VKAVDSGGEPDRRVAAHGGMEERGRYPAPAEANREPPVDGTRVDRDGAVRGVGQDHRPLNRVAGDDTTRREGQMDLDGLRRRRLCRRGRAPPEEKGEGCEKAPAKLHPAIVVGRPQRVHERVGALSEAC
jgi:hypothetical protein